MAALLLPVACLLQVFGPGSTATPVEANNLDGLIENDRLKFVFVGGKGGVGKTTSSSAIASQLSLAINQSSGSNRRILLISTDPAHSLSDAFRMKFSNVPTQILPELPNLEVMEVNPAVIMKRELAGWTELAKELGFDPEAGSKDANDQVDGGIGQKLYSFQEWLSGIPGIDEATALSSAIEHIESGRYDMIVFDTAPTGHTLKLLELPGILQAGLDKLESWQATLWGYWEMIKGFTSGGSSGDSGSVKAKVAEKLKTYKASIGRVADMITDKVRTRFVVVCIAEYLSISESRRLLSELDRFGVMASHIVVNQLVTDFLETSELAELESYTHKQAAAKEGAILEKALAAAKLTSARRNIQSKYLKELKACPEVNRKPDPEEPQIRTNTRAGTNPLTVLEVPLLPGEVTGAKAILSFSNFLVGKDIVGRSASAVGVESERSRQAKAKEKMQEQEKRAPDQSGSNVANTKKKKKGPDMAKARGLIEELLQDSELKKMIEENPKLADIVEEVKQNPMAGMKYLGDPSIQKFLSKAMGKILGGAGGGGAGGGGLNDLLGGAGLGGQRKAKKKKKTKGSTEL